jgi:hypothetical protein
MEPKVFVSGVHLYRMLLKDYNFLVRVKYLISLLLVAATLSGCSSSKLDKDSLTAAWQIEDLGPDNDEFWRSEYFKDGLELFKEAAACQAKLKFKWSWDQDSKKKIPLWGDVQMVAYQTDIDFYPTRYLYRDYLDIPDSDNWGNKVDKTLVITSAYLWRLRLLHDEINLNHGNNFWGEYLNYERQKSTFNYYNSKNGVLGDFEKYFDKAATLAKELCYKGENPTSQQVITAELEYDILLKDWEPFNKWLTQTTRYVNDVNDIVSKYPPYDEDYVDDTPVCKEYPTTLPGYVIVKCTNLP